MANEHDEIRELRGLIQDLLDRIELLEETVNEQDETIRGLITDTEQNSEECNNLRAEFDLLSEEVDRFYENENA